MKLVIEIPEEAYKLLLKEQRIPAELDCEYLIMHGTPLPQGRGDLIDRDKVIDLLNEQEYNYYTELDKVVDTVCEADAIIEADEGGSGMRWIPCDERLPEIEDHYVSKPCIVYFDNGAYGFAELQENIFGQVGWNCERDDEYHEPLGNVIAWMPLPKPYKADKGEQE